MSNAKVTWEVKSSGFDTLCASDDVPPPATVVVHCRDMSDGSVLGSAHIYVYREVVHHACQGDEDHPGVFSRSLTPPEGYWAYLGRCRIVGLIHHQVRGSLKLAERPYVYTIGNFPLDHQAASLRDLVEDFAVGKLRDALLSVLLDRLMVVTADPFRCRGVVIGTTADGFRIYRY